MPVSSLDLLPTALAAAGIDVPDDVTLDGIDLLPVLTGAKNPEPRTLTWRFPFPPPRPDLYVWAVRQGDWKPAPDRNRVGVSGRSGVSFGPRRSGRWPDVCAMVRKVGIRPLLDPTPETAMRRDYGLTR